MENTELLKKEREEAIKILWYRITNVSIILPILFSFILMLGFASGSVYYSGGNELISWLFIALAGISTTFFTNKLSKIHERNKMRNKAISAVRNLDNIRLNLIRSRKKADDPILISTIEFLEGSVINAIEEWNDILPDLKYRDMTEVKLALESFKQKHEKSPSKELENRIEKLEEELDRINYLRLKSTGGGILSLEPQIDWNKGTSATIGDVVLDNEINIQDSISALDFNGTNTVSIDDITVKSLKG